MRFLAVPVPVTGHFNPVLPVAKMPAERGHEVRWYTSARFQAKIEATGARFVAFQIAQDIDYDKANDLFPERTKLKGWRQLQSKSQVSRVRKDSRLRLRGFLSCR